MINLAMTVIISKAAKLTELGESINEVHGDLSVRNSSTGTTAVGSVPRAIVVNEKFLDDAADGRFTDRIHWSARHRELTIAFTDSNGTVVWEVALTAHIDPPGVAGAYWFLLVQRPAHLVIDGAVIDTPAIGPPT